MIAGLLMLFALLAWVSAASESSTYDEPLHIASSLAISQKSDFRVDSEDPALFKRWLAMFLPDQPLPTESPFFASAGRDAPSQWAWAVLTVFDQPPEKALAAIDRGRLAMLLLGVALGALIATWAWQLGGPAAGVIATAVFALDPNFIAHSPLAKNDVAAALGYTATAYALWHVGRRATIVNVIGLSLAVTATVTFKFSGVLLAGLVPLMLLLRALITAPWPIGVLPLPEGERAGVRRETSHDELRSISQTASSNVVSRDQRQSTLNVSPLTPTLSPLGRGSRIGVAIAISLFVGIVTLAAIWAIYGFRYASSPDSTYVLDVTAQSAEGSPLRWIDRVHLLPQAYTFGLAYTLNSAVTRSNFLLGQVSNVGHWYYFPIAMAVKTPLATIGLLVFAIGVLVRRRSRLREHRWSAICLALPAAIYLAMAMRSNLNIGLRHMLPIYPLAFVAIAVLVARYRRTVAILLALLAIESAVAFPNDLAYFNLAAGGSRGGLKLLADSNLDWGQGLKHLADWQAEHPNEKLYLSYFGTAEPATYGVDATNALAGYAYGLPPVMPDSPGVLAVSATQLQGLYVDPKWLPLFETLRKIPPREVLGGAIYLYDWPLLENDQSSHSNDRGNSHI